MFLTEADKLTLQLLSGQWTLTTKGNPSIIILLEKGFAAKTVSIGSFDRLLTNGLIEKTNSNDQWILTKKGRNLNFSAQKTE